MEQLIAIIEKGQPFFNAIARNKYLKAIRDGFISVIPIIIFSSIFCLVASVPNIWGFYWPDDINNALWKCYNYSMGILAITCAATTAKHFADAQNRDLPKNNQINFISCMCAAIIGFLLLSSDTIATDAASGFNTTYLGSKGLLTAFIAAFVTGIIYKFFIKRNITVKMPEQVPPNISQTFKDIIPFSVCITVFWVFDIVFRAAFGFCFAQGVIQVFQPLFTDDLSFPLARHANEMAARLQDGLRAKGWPLWVDSPTNQVFAVVDNALKPQLDAVCDYEDWCPYDGSHTVVRFVTCFQTSQEDVDGLLAALPDLH